MGNKEGTPLSLRTMRVGDSVLPPWVRNMPGIDRVPYLGRLFPIYVVTRRLGNDPEPQQHLREVVLEGRFPTGERALDAARKLLKETENGKKD